MSELVDVSPVTGGLVTLQEESLIVGSLLADAVEPVLALLETKRHLVACTFRTSNFFVGEDRTRLIQMFSNVLNDAAKHTPIKEHVTLRILPNEAHVEVAVASNGRGTAATLLSYSGDLLMRAKRSLDPSQGGLDWGSNPQA